MFPVAAGSGRQHFQHDLRGSQRHGLRDAPHTVRPTAAGRHCVQSCQLLAAAQWAQGQTASSHRAWWAGLTTANGEQRAGLGQCCSPSIRMHLAGSPCKPNGNLPVFLLPVTRPCALTASCPHAGCRQRNTMSRRRRSGWPTCRGITTISAGGGMLVFNLRSHAVQAASDRLACLCSCGMFCTWAVAECCKGGCTCTLSGKSG